jgi:uncharacterized protein YggE
MRHLILLPFAALAACQPAAPDPRGVDHDETLLTVSATGRAETRPDEARFTLGVETIAASAREASRLNNEKMQSVAAALRAFGVEEKDLQTQNLGLGRIDYGPDRGKYRAANNVEVRLHAMDKVSDAVAATTEAGANLVTGPRLVVSDSEGASKSAYASAYKAARTRADAYAEAAGLKVTRVLAIRDGGESYAPPTPMESVMVAQAAPAPAAPPPPPPFIPGLNRTQVSVTVNFALEPQ